MKINYTFWPLGPGRPGKPPGPGRPRPRPPTDPGTPSKPRSPLMPFSGAMAGGKMTRPASPPSPLEPLLPFRALTPLENQSIIIPNVKKIFSPSDVYHLRTLNFGLCTMSCISDLPGYPRKTVNSHLRHWMSSGFSLRYFLRTDMLIELMSRDLYSYEKSLTRRYV